MISDIAWENIVWLKEAFFAQLNSVGGRSIAVNSFSPYLKRNWIKRLKPAGIRRTLFADIESWAVGIKTTPLTTDFKMEHWTKGIQVARGGQEYSEHLWFLYRNHYNIYALATHRKTIEELALGAYAYCSLPYLSAHVDDTEKGKAARKKLLADRKRAFSDFRRLLRLSKTFLLAQWVQDMIELAIANEDRGFFHVLSNAIRKNTLASPTTPAIEWVLVILLWFLGGKEYDRRRSFLHELQQHNILPRSVTEPILNAELRRFGLTTTSL
jgi:hypothetical protein